MDIFRVLSSLFTQILQKLGLLNKQAKILLLGLDNAGKTTLLYVLKEGTVKSFVPTERAHVEEIQLGKLSFKAWDLGGHERVRTLWQDFLVDADAIIFMVDSGDSDRFPEASRELHALLQTETSNIPVVVLANKCDLKW
eukprot:CAMPEP_0184647628 /NCGR_PEP_ID=MMETSP0308-20130426/4607_1 /TAXON_ID=38269 /ORGANISM="Gloeochaete witrockiana, Strain SAG 46.84" /LENGTH=138 /DNA_ID=CAMNT_0027078775 /DNA_START=121 /DNA_END=534 /DNA_ORIENTATION=-